MGRRGGTLGKGPRVQEVVEHLWNDLKELHRGPLPDLRAKWTSRNRGCHLHSLVTLSIANPSPPFSPTSLF